MKLKFLRTSLNQSNICCSFFWGKFLQDEEVSETSATDYGILRIGFKIIEKFIKLNLLQNFKAISNFQKCIFLQRRHMILFQI